MDWSDIKPWIAKAAPLVGTALGGPFGTMAGAMVAQALGTKDASPESIKAAIQAGNLTGDQMVALKEAEQTFALEMAKLGITSTQQLEELAYKDRDSARTREISVKDWTPRILAYGVTLGFFGLLWHLLRHAVPPVSRDILNVMLGSLGTAWISIISYYFGTTANSSRKDEMLHNSTPIDMDKR